MAPIEAERGPGAAPPSGEAEPRMEDENGEKIAAKNVEEEAAKSGKRTLRARTASEKLRIIQRVRDGESKASISRRYKVPESTLRGWCKAEDKIRNIVQNNSETSESEALSPETATAVTSNCEDGAAGPSPAKSWRSTAEEKENLAFANFAYQPKNMEIMTALVMNSTVHPEHNALLLQPSSLIRTAQMTEAVHQNGPPMASGEQPAIAHSSNQDTISAQDKELYMRLVHQQYLDQAVAPPAHTANLPENDILWQFYKNYGFGIGVNPGTPALLPGQLQHIQQRNRQRQQQQELKMLEQQQQEQRSQELRRQKQQQQQAKLQQSEFLQQLNLEPVEQPEPQEQPDQKQEHEPAPVQAKADKNKTASVKKPVKVRPGIEEALWVKNRMAHSRNMNLAAGGDAALDADLAEDLSCRNETCTDDEALKSVKSLRTWIDKSNDPSITQVQVVLLKNLIANLEKRLQKE